MDHDDHHRTPVSLEVWIIRQGASDIGIHVDFPRQCLQGQPKLADERLVFEDGHSLAV